MQMTQEIVSPSLIFQIETVDKELILKNVCTPYEVIPYRLVRPTSMVHFLMEGADSNMGHPSDRHSLLCQIK